MLPGSICRENILASFSWQEVSLSFSVETCVGLCKSQCAEAFHRVPALRRRGLFFRSGKKNRGRMNLSVLAPSFNCAAKFLCFPAQSVARIFLLHFLGKRSRSLFLWKPVHPCANPRQRGPWSIAPSRGVHMASFFRPSGANLLGAKVQEAGIAFSNRRTSLW